MEAEKPKWNTISEKGETKFFSPEVGKSYRITISQVELVEKAFKKGDAPKMKVQCVLSSIDGLPSNKIWETGSFAVMRELKTHVLDEKWNGHRITYLLKKKNEGEKVSFVFEELGEAML